MLNIYIQKFPSFRNPIPPKYQSITTSKQIRFTSNIATSVWKDNDDPRDFIDFASHHLSINNLDDWYKVSPKQLHQLGGADLLHRRFNGLPSALLQTIFPTHNWLPWKFSTLPRKYWDDMNNHRKFMEWAGEQLKIKNNNDWYRISIQELQNIGGTPITRKFNDSMYYMLCSVFPEHEWLPWKFEKTNKKYWSDVEMQIKFVEWVGKKLGVKELDDWYKVSLKEFYDVGGTPLLSRYNVSPYNVLSVVYPNHNWIPWKFEKLTSTFWDDFSNQRNFLEWAKNELKINEKSDWYKVTVKDINDLGGGYLVNRKYNSVCHLLSVVYREETWEPQLFAQDPVPSSQ